MFRTRTKDHIRQRLFFIGLLMIRCIYGYTQNSDILSDVMNAQLSSYELVGQRNINTPDLEFSPAVYLDSIVYVGSGRTAGKRDKAGTYFNLYLAAVAGDGSLVGESAFDALNSHFHEGPLVFNKEGDKVFFTRNNQVEGAKNHTRMNLSIYTSEKRDGIWSEPAELFRAGEVSFCHPAISSGGDRLYFSSNMPGGYGNYDLYYIERVDGLWSAPVNLGPTVNTGDNELFATLLTDGLIAFSSNRPGGKGGFDIYSAELANGRVVNTTILPAPINSEGDDMSLVIGENPAMAYFSSSRSGGAGQDDIYLLRPIKAPEPVMVEQGLIVIDSVSMRRLQDVRIVITNRAGSPVLEGMTDRNGTFRFSLARDATYAVEIMARDFSPYVTAITGGVNKTIRLQPLPCLTLSGIALDQDNNEVMPGIEMVLQTGCGLPDMTTMTDSLGRFSFCLPPGCSAMLTGQQIEFYPVRVPVSEMTDNLKINVNFSRQKLSIVKGAIKKGSVLLLENIYYDFNESTMRPGTERELNELAVLLNQYPNMRVNLITHTDARGDAKANLTLSINRALEARKYLVEKGIDESRIETEGRGESQLRNRCKDGVNCTEDEHQYNRRIEVKILEK